ncbi:hypothetical protein KY360_00855 [Candidatus Woesearchaeota archaeon]|nr:hypothetical protein [Candidatus Woesearchaeota archaeon]
MNKKWFVLLLIMGLVLAGCEGEEQAPVTKEVSPYIGGTKGLVTEFLDMGIYNDESRMNEIFEGESFPIEILLRNKGEEDLRPGDVVVRIKGISLTDFSGIVAGGILQNTEAIERVSDVNNMGGEDTLDFTPGAEDARYLVKLASYGYDVDVFAEVVYNYKTHSSVPKVCFKEDLMDPSICEVDEVKDVFSSAAPIQVISAEEKRAGTGKIAVEFKIENVGGGDVTMPGEDFNSRYDQLIFESSDPDEWECKSGGKLNAARLDNEGKATVICKLRAEMAEDTLYTKQLDLTLMYKYRTLIQESVRVLKQ